ncbi:MAG: DUF4838 domain-containing protein [Clostridiales bacterium]|nr:DUF4838 domain-containing protein [Clostridiales bacterium]
MKWLIKVDTKQYKDVYEGNNDQENINWWDELDKRSITCTECFLAIDLETQLKRYTKDVSINDLDKKVDVIISVGSICKKKDNSLIGEQGLVEIKKIDGIFNVYLYGQSREGTINSVYHFLSLLGYKFYNTDDFGNIAPKLISLKEIYEVYNPDYITRGCYSEFMDDTHNGFINWMTRNHMNMLKVANYTNPFELKKRGISLLSGGHEIFYLYLNPKNIDKTSNNKKTYFDNHNDWFALIDGKRSSKDENSRATEGYYTGDNICTSNKEGTNHLFDNIIQSFINGVYKYCDYLNFWAYDNGTWCQCEKCKKTGNYATRMLLLAYELDKAIKKAQKEGRLRRKIKLLIPVYHETLQPPEIDLPIDFDYQNVIATFFPIERCYAHFINDEKCTETNIHLKNLYEKWTVLEDRKYKGEIFIGEYFNVSSFASMPFVFKSIITHDLPYYFKNNTKHFYYMHITSLEWGMLTVNNYLIAKLLSNINVDSTLVLSNYYNDVFKSSAKLISEFHELLEKASKNSKYLKHYQFEKFGKEKPALMWKMFDNNLFPLAHCKFDAKSDDENSAVSMTETMDLFEQAKELLNVIINSCDKSEYQAVMLEKQRFDYGYKIFNFIYNLVQLRLAHINGNKEEMSNKLFRTEQLKSELLLITRPLEDAKYKSLNWLENAYTATWVKGRYEDYIKKVKKFVSD